jgi:hypothetical protein
MRQYLIAHQSHLPHSSIFDSDKAIMGGFLYPPLAIISTSHSQFVNVIGYKYPVVMPVIPYVCEIKETNTFYTF